MVQIDENTTFPAGRPARKSPWPDLSVDRPPVFRIDTFTVVVQFGIGTEHKITTRLTLRFDLEFFEEDAQLLSINLMRRFDGGK